MNNSLNILQLITTYSWNPLYNHEYLPKKCNNDIIHNFQSILAWDCFMKYAPQTIKPSQDIVHFCDQTTLKLPFQILQTLQTT
jgi:hypothetical protein